MIGLLRLQQIYQSLQVGNEAFQITNVRKIVSLPEAIKFLHVIESHARWDPKFIVLDCSTDLAKKIIVNHVRDISLGKRTYHYLLSGLVSVSNNHNTTKLSQSFLIKNFHKKTSTKLSRS